MKIARLRMLRFRGFESADILLHGHTVIAGEPRAGRSDIVQALRRVLDPASTRSRVNPLDIHRQAPAHEAGNLPAKEPEQATHETDMRTEVEVTLLELGPELEDLLDDYLEAFDPDTVELANGSNPEAAVLGIRLCYRATYDFESDTGDHWVDSPARSDVDAEVFRKIPRADREALPILFLEIGPALQIRAEGAFRALVSDAGGEELDGALRDLGENIRTATETFSYSPPLSKGIQQVIDSGAGALLGISASDAFTFVTDDGTLSTLLRALQPAAALDEAGMLPLRAHGSTAQALLSVAEGVAAATAGSDNLIVVGDDFGDQLDAPSAEHLARLLHVSAHQVILTTRRAEVVRAFQPEDLLRLTRSHGGRRQHRLAKADKHGRVYRRLVLDQLLAALTSQKVVLLEGPLDLEGYGALAARYASTNSPDPKYSLAGNSVRLVCPPGADGGNTRLVGLAELAAELGFHVRAVMDTDKPGDADDILDVLLAVCEQVVVLPKRTAVEAALIRGIPGTKLRTTVQALVDEGCMSELPDTVGNDDIADYLIRSKVVKKQGLHTAWALALTAVPPLGSAVIEAICSDQTGRVDIPGHE